LEVSAESEVFVFVDSDARPGADWLRNLIAPLQDKTIGCATGYRWFVPQRGGFSTALRSVWNASIASHLGANRRAIFAGAVRWQSGAKRSSV
jgi:cellulose synthase/poly-beta-1,6-N-acetylglucosamine synthase-like glycosyltransferase